MPRPWSDSMISRRCRVERATRSIFQTTKVSSSRVLPEARLARAIAAPTRCLVLPKCRRTRQFFERVYLKSEILSSVETRT